MTDYIEREAAIDAMTERKLVVHMDSVNDGLVASCHRSAQRIIANIPAADVRPVVRGKWKLATFHDGYGAYHLYKCDKCGERRAQRCNFCPNCGADMRIKHETLST